MPKKLTQTPRASAKRVIIYGDSKTGKSLLAAQLAERFNLLWFDLEKGSEVLYSIPEEWQERIELISIPDSPGIPMAIESCLKLVRGPVKICDLHGKVACHFCVKESLDIWDVDFNSLSSDTIVVFDSLTQLVQSATNHLTKGKPDLYKFEFDDWRNLATLIEKFLSYIQVAPYHVVVISHSTETEQEGTKKKTVVPVGGSRNFSRNVPRFFDEVVYAERKNKKHVFASDTGYNNAIITGSRTQVALEFMDKPSLLPIFLPDEYAAPVPESKVPATVAQRVPVKPVAKGATLAGNTSAADMLAKLKARSQK